MTTTGNVSIQTPESSEFRDAFNENSENLIDAFILLFIYAQSLQTLQDSSFSGTINLGTATSIDVTDGLITGVT